MFTAIRLTNVSASSCGLPLDLELYAEGLVHVPGATSYQPREEVVPRSYPIANHYTDPVLAPANAVLLTFVGASFLPGGGGFDDIVLEFLTIRFPEGDDILLDIAAAEEGHIWANRWWGPIEAGEGFSIRAAASSRPDLRGEVLGGWP